MPDWQSLEHAYGTAEDLPSLLAQLESFPDESSCESEPWFSLWSSLYHQGDIYSASFAAVPAIVRCMKGSPDKVTASFFSLPASIEVARKKAGMDVPEEMRKDYFSALALLGRLASDRLRSEASEDVARSAIAAFAVSAGQHLYAELLLEVSAEEVPEVLDWYMER